MDKHLFPYKWYLKDGYPKSNRLNVFGTFVCGGGSTMGYKLAGFNHLGGVEIDNKIADIYKANHDPKYFYLQDIREFNKRTDLPEELYNLDMLDGSPPCSTFSMAGSREKAWNKKKQFREGQTKQVLDDLVFVYCDTIIKLKPKVFILENVKGIIQGNAKSYSKAIVKKMTEAGYKVQVFLLNAASMGVPQKRERVFFIGSRNEFKLPKLVLKFSEKVIPFRKVSDNIDKENNEGKKGIQKYDYWHKVKPGQSYSEVHPKQHFFGNKRLSNKEVASTVIADLSNGDWNSEYCRMLNKTELCKIGTYPLDYNFKDIKPKYLIGMSVPPVMTAQIATQIYKQWFNGN